MKIIKAMQENFDEAMEIYAAAQRFMAENGNPDQWGSVYPPAEMVRDDIDAGRLYFCMDGDETACIFCYAVEEEPYFDTITDGAWLDDAEYATVHRVASTHRVKGAAAACLKWAYEQFPNIRIDTYRDNIPMQRLLEKLGFVHCGTVFYDGDKPRMAYQKK